MAEMQTETGAPPPRKGNDFPPLDATTFVPQLFWLAVVFTLLYVAARAHGASGIERVIRDRKKPHCRRSQRRATLRKEAEAALESLREIDGGCARISGLDRDGGAHGHQGRGRQAARCHRRRACGQVEAAEAQVAEAKKRAIAGVRTVAIEVAGAIVEKVLHERPSAADLSRVVDDELRAA